MKSLKFWVVCTTEDMKKNIKRYLTIVNTRDQALEWIKQRLKFDNINHYSRWSELHEYNPNDPATIDIYIKTVLSSSELKKYSFGKVMFNEVEMAAMFRIVHGCIPIGCSFDTLDEIKFSLLRLPEEKINDLYDQIKDACKEKKDEGQK